MPDFEDYYEILGVGSKATPDEITKAWKDKFWILSPDRMNGAPETAKKRAEEELKKVNNAYDTLKDPQKKRNYDKQWHQIKDKPKPVVAPPNIRFNNVNPKEVKTGSFVIRNLGGPYNKINISNPNTWVKVVRWHSLTSADELPLQVEIEAAGEDFGNNYSEQIKVNLDDEETYVIIELQTRSKFTTATGTGTQNKTFSSGQASQSVPTPSKKTGSKPKQNYAKVLLFSLGLFMILGIVIGILLSANKQPPNPSASFSPTSTVNQKNLQIVPTAPSTQTPTNITYTVGTLPIAICFAGTNIWVANGNSNNVTELRASDGYVLGTYPVPHPIGICFDGTNIWVANGISNNITELRASDGYVLGTYTVGTSPRGICFDGTNIWVTNFGSNNVTELRASDGYVLGTYAGGTSPTDICFDGTNIWVTYSTPTSNNVTELRASDGSILGTYTVGISPTGICFDGTNIWVANGNSNNVTELRASDGTLMGTYTVGTLPRGICFDGDNIWVTNLGSNNVTELRASDGTLMGTYAVGTAPWGICFDGINIWVANSGSNNVTKLTITK